MAENGGTDREQILETVAAPAHPRAGETRLKLLGPRFNHPGTNRIAFFTKFEILHPAFVILEEIGLRAQVLSALRLTTSAVTELRGNPLSVTLEKGGFSGRNIGFYLN